MPVGLPRELIRWLQSLDLPFQVTRPKTDLCNGYLIAEIAARYWHGVELHMYENKLSTKQREANWAALRAVFERNGFHPPPGMIDDVSGAKENAAVAFLELFYMALTRREIQHLPGLGEAEVEHIPKFIKSTSPAVQQAVLQSAEEQRMREQALLLQQQQAQQQVQSKTPEASPEKGKRTSPGRSPGARAKLTQKVQTIKSISDATNEDTAAGNLVQFTNVTVKPLAPQTLHRFGGGRTSSPKRGERDSGDDDTTTHVLGVLSGILEKRLSETGTPPWPLSGSVPTSAEYFARYSKTLNPSLTSVLWSALFSQASEVASSLVQRPWNFESFLTSFLLVVFDPRPFPRRSSPFSSEDEKADYDSMRSFLRCVMTLIAQQNFNMGLFFVRTVLMPRFLATVHFGDRAERREVIATLKAALPSDDPHTAAVSGLLVVIYDYLCTHDVANAVPLSAEARQQQGGNAKTIVAHDGFGAFLRVLFDFTELLAKRRAIPAGNAASEFGEELTLGVSVAKMVYFHAASGLASASTKIRTLAVAVLRQLVRCGHVALVAPHVSGIAAHLGLNGSSPSNFELMAQSLLLIVEVMRATCASKVNGNGKREAAAEGEATDDAAVPFKIARAAAISIFNEMCTQKYVLSLRVPTKINLLLIKFLCSALKYADRESDENIAEEGQRADDLFAILKDLPMSSIGVLFASKTERGETLTTPLFGCPNVYDASDFHNTCHTLALVSAATRALRSNAPPGRKTSGTSVRSAKISESEALLLVWLRRLIVKRSASLPLCVWDSDVPLWWDQLRRLRELLETAVYAADIAAQKGGDATEILEQGAIAKAILVRFYVSLSGINILPEHREIEHPDEQMQNKALEWFRTIVPMS